jgi:hypothetical protein
MIGFAKKGLPHLERCPFCDQEEGTINHLLLSSAFSCQTWFSVLQGLSLQVLAPQPEKAPLVIGGTK